MGQKIYDIKIKQVENGYTVKVGCKKFVFESAGKLISELAAYLDDPGSKHKEHGVSVDGLISWDLTSSGSPPD